MSAGKIRLIYVAAAAGFAFFASLHHDVPEMGALYLIPAVLCIAQLVRPARAIWAVVFGLYAAGAVLYVGLLFRDFFRLLRNERPAVLVDADDSAFFIIFVMFIVTVFGFLYRLRPWRVQK